MSISVFVVVGAKGGVGTSTLATQLVEELPSDGTRYLVDADLAGKRAAATWYDVAKDLDIARIPGHPSTARKGNVTVAELARSYEDGFIISQETVEEFLASLPPDSMVVVDAPQPFAATVRPFMLNAAKVVVVTEPTLLGVGSAHAMLSALDRFGVPESRIAFVLYDLHGSQELRAKEIADSLKYTIAAELPAPRDRNSSRAIARLVETLASTSDMPLLTLRASASQPIGQRRRAQTVETKVSGVALAGAELLKAELHAALLTRIDFLAAARAHTDAEKMAELRAQISAIADEFLASRSDITSAEQASHVRHEVIEEALGFGPLQSLLEDPTITEVMVNGFDNVFIE
ncbi:MAG: hypothetical protein ACREMT_10185, partial [Vulcanimicrobiaceae bacterium]